MRITYFFVVGITEGKRKFGDLRVDRKAPLSGS
jgi:hypothetical protein